MNRTCATFLGILLTIVLLSPAAAQLLFAGLEDASLPTRTSNLAGFPNLTWVDRFAFEVNGAACSPSGTLYLCNGAFTTRLYQSSLAGPPVFIGNTTVDIHGMGFGRGRLYGFSNFASPMGIYSIDPATGAAVLLIDTGSFGYRFFGLDHNALDDHLYGYTEYGTTGLYKINLDTGAMERIAAPPPGVNGQGRALAVGNNTVYLLATRGDEQEPCFAYDLAQGSFGSWVAFTNPYPLNHNTGGATWIPAPADMGDAAPPTPGLRLTAVNPCPAGTPASLFCVFPGSGQATIEIFDAAGRLEAVPFSGTVAAGTRVIAWDPQTPGGTGSGVYFARLRSGGEQQDARITILR